MSASACTRSMPGLACVDAFVAFGLVSSMLHQTIGWKECLRHDLFMSIGTYNLKSINRSISLTIIVKYGTIAEEIRLEKPIDV